MVESQVLFLRNVLWVGLDWTIWIKMDENLDRCLMNL